jgi:hypothetical protein
VVAGDGDGFVGVHNSSFGGFQGKLFEKSFP